MIQGVSWIQVVKDIFRYMVFFVKDVTRCLFLFQLITIHLLLVGDGKSGCRTWSAKYVAERYGNVSYTVDIKLITTRVRVPLIQEKYYPGNYKKETNNISEDR